MVLNLLGFLPSRERIYFFILKKFFRLKFENLNLDILIKYNSYKKKGCIRNSQVTYVIAVWKNVVG